MALEILNRGSYPDDGSVSIGIRKAPESMQTTTRTQYDLYVSVPPSLSAKINDPLRIDLAIDADTQCLYLYQNHGGIKFNTRGTGSKRKTIRIRITGRSEKIIDGELPLLGYEAEISTVGETPAIKVHCPALFRKQPKSLTIAN